MAIKKDPTMLIRKHANELKVKKTVRTAIKQDLSPDLNPPDYAIWGVLEKNKTNVNSHPYITSLKTAIEKKWKKISEEFILKSCKSFRRRIDRIIKKTVAILNKFTVLYYSS